MAQTCPNLYYLWCKSCDRRRFKFFYFSWEFFFCLFSQTFSTVKKSWLELDILWRGITGSRSWLSMCLCWFSLIGISLHTVEPLMTTISPNNSVTPGLLHQIVFFSGRPMVKQVGQVKVGQAIEVSFLSFDNFRVWSLQSNEACLHGSRWRVAQ